MDLLGNGSSLSALWPGSPDKGCKTVITMNVTNIAFYMLGFFFMVFLCNGSHALLRPLSQPRIVSEASVGLFLGNMPFIKYGIDSKEGNKTLKDVADVGMICHMFVLGLDIDPTILLKPSSREAKVVCAGMFSSFLLTLLVTPFLYIPKISNLVFNLSLSVVVSGTASPLLTRLITDQKIGKSDIGRFVVFAGTLSDLVSTLLLSLGYILFDPLRDYHTRYLKEILGMISTLVIQSVMAAKVSPIFMNWVNSHNPEGKPIKGSHLVLSIAYVVVLCGCSPTMAGFNKMLSAFLVGVFMPREGRISRMMINKVHYFLITIFYPLFFFWVGTETNLINEFEGSRIQTWAKFFFLFMTATAGKVAGTVVSGVMLGFHWPESVAIGLLLNIKGHIHVYLAIIAEVYQITTVSTSTTMVFAAFLTIIYAPLVVANIIQRARKRSPMQRLALQWHDPSSELHILMCLHGPHNVPCAINFMEISRGPVEPGIVVYLVDMIELTDKVAATLRHGDGGESVTVTDKSVMGKREQITNAVKAYLDQDGNGISIRRMISLATINNMHQDICIRAEDLSVYLIILPFHKDQQTGGRFNAGHSGFRHVNRKVLRHAPCSVGILVDRGLGLISNIAGPTVALNAAVIFIGGKDDREALAYAGRMARHPGVKLTVVRFLLDSNSESATTKSGRARVKSPEQEEEMKLDDEFFAVFYDKYVAEGYVAYMEKYVANSGETFSILQSFEGQYELFIVGRGGRANSVLTKGMNDWEECPELGPVGDILSTSEFSVTASVLIIQQHSLKGELDGLDDEFTIM